MKPRRIFSYIFLLLLPLLAFSACGLQNVIATPTAWIFPSLTPRVTWTPYPTITGIPSATTHPAAPAAAGVGTPMPRVREILSAENAAQIELLAHRGRGIPLLLRLSPDGARLGVATTRGVYLYDAGTLQEAGAIETEALPTCLAFSDDGGLLAWGARDGSLHLWDTVQLAPLLEWRAGTLPVLSVAFSPAADQLAVSLWDKTVHLYRTADGQQLYNWEVHLRPVTELSFSSSGELVLAWAYKESIQEWQVEDGQSVGTLYVGEDETGRLPVSAAFSSDRSLFASNHGMRIRLFRTRNGTTLRLFRDLDEEVRHLVLSPDGTRLAALEETHIQVWESESGERLGQVALSEESPSRLLMAFNLTGDVLYTLGDALQAWRIGDGGELVAERSAEFASSNLLAAALQEEPAVLLTGSMNGVLRMYTLDVGSLEQSQTLADDTLESLALDPSSGLAAGAGPYSDTRLWHDADPALATVIAGQDGRVTCLAFSVDGSMLASGAEDQTVAVWDSQDASLLNILNLDATPQEIFFHPSGDWLVVRLPGEVQVWNLQENRQAFSSSGYAFALAGDGSLLAIARDLSQNRSVQFYEMPGGEEAGKVPGSSAYLALSADGGLLAIGSESITLWDTSSLQAVALLAGEPAGKLLFSPDGLLLLQVGWDGALRMWGVP